MEQKKSFKSDEYVYYFSYGHGLMHICINMSKIIDSIIQIQAVYVGQLHPNETV